MMSPKETKKYNETVKEIMSKKNIDKIWKELEKQAPSLDGGIGKY
jgi:hypothetical protein